MPRGRKNHLNIATFLHMPTAGIEPGPPAQQAVALSITPLPLGQLLLVRTHPLLAKLAFQPYRIKNYRWLAPNLLGDEHIGCWQLKHVVMMMATKMSLGLDMCSSNLDTLSPIKLFQKVEITGKMSNKKTSF